MEPRAVPPEPAAFCAADPRRKTVDQALKRLRYRPDALIEVLHIAQNAYGFLGADVLGHIARRLKLPESRVFGVATFYHAFTLRPKGEHRCIVCTGTVCHLKGAGAIVKALEAAYAIHPGQTTPDSRLSLGTTRCLGTCSLAPLLMVDATVQGHVRIEGAADRVEAALKDAPASREAAS